MLVGSWDGYPLGLIRTASDCTLLCPCRVIMESFGKVVPELPFHSQHCLIKGGLLRVGTCLERTASRKMVQDSTGGPSNEIWARRIHTEARRYHLE